MFIARIKTPSLHQWQHDRVVFSEATRIFFADNKKEAFDELLRLLPSKNDQVLKALRTDPKWKNIFEPGEYFEVHWIEVPIHQLQSLLIPDHGEEFYRGHEVIRI